MYILYIPTMNLHKICSPQKVTSTSKYDINISDVNNVLFTNKKVVLNYHILIHTQIYYGIKGSFINVYSRDPITWNNYWQHVSFIYIKLNFNTQVPWFFFYCFTNRFTNSIIYFHKFSVTRFIYPEIIND